MSFNSEGHEGHKYIKFMSIGSLIRDLQVKNVGKIGKFDLKFLATPCVWAREIYIVGILEDRAIECTMCYFNPSVAPRDVPLSVF